MSFGTGGPVGAVAVFFGEGTEAYFSGMSFGPVKSFGGGTGFGDCGAMSCSYMSRISLVELSRPGKS